MNIFKNSIFFLLIASLVVLVTSGFYKIMATEPYTGELEFNEGEYVPINPDSTPPGYIWSDAQSEMDYYYSLPQETTASYGYEFVPEGVIRIDDGDNGEIVGYIGSYQLTGEPETEWYPQNYIGYEPETVAEEPIAEPVTEPVTEHTIEIPASVYEELQYYEPTTEAIYEYEQNNNYSDVIIEEKSRLNHPVVITEHLQSSINLTSYTFYN